MGMPVLPFTLKKEFNRRFFGQLELDHVTNARVKLTTVHE